MQHFHKNELLISSYKLDKMLDYTRVDIKKHKGLKRFLERVDFRSYQRFNKRLIFSTKVCELSAKRG